MVVAVVILLFQNAFSDKLSAFDFNVFDMLVVDLLHEVELCLEGSVHSSATSSRLRRWKIET